MVDHSVFCPNLAELERYFYPPSPSSPSKLLSFLFRLLLLYQLALYSLINQKASLGSSWVAFAQRRLLSKLPLPLAPSPWCRFLCLALPCPEHARQPALQRRAWCVRGTQSQERRCQITWHTIVGNVGHGGSQPPGLFIHHIMDETSDWVLSKPSLPMFPPLFFSAMGPNPMGRHNLKFSEEGMLWVSVSFLVAGFLVFDACLTLVCSCM